MATEATSPPVPRPMRRRPGSVAASVLGLGLALGLAGCARDRGSITPTTTGTDFSNVPRGRMVPQPFPGSSLAENVTSPHRPSAEWRAVPDGPILTAGSSDAVIR